MSKKKKWWGSGGVGTKFSVNTNWNNVRYIRKPKLDIDESVNINFKVVVLWVIWNTSAILKAQGYVDRDLVVTLPSWARLGKPVTACVVCPWPIKPPARVQQVTLWARSLVPSLLFQMQPCVCLPLFSATSSQCIRVRVNQNPKPDLGQWRRARLSSIKASKKGEGWEWCESAPIVFPLFCPFLLCQRVAAKEILFCEKVPRFLLGGA